MIKRILLGLLVVFVLIQLYRPSHASAPVDQTKAMERSLSIPRNVQTVLSRSCNDCHSGKTTWPWYSQIAPVSWWLDQHVKEGLGKLNFSQWGDYTARKKRKKLEEICEQVNKGDMPLPSYLWIHRDAKLSPADKTLLCDWANAEKATLPPSPPRAAGERAGGG
jgi:Haem-binding domain